MGHGNTLYDVATIMGHGNTLYDVATIMGHGWEHMGHSNTKSQ